jgi:hypothetical protein
VPPSNERANNAHVTHRGGRRSVLVVLSSIPKSPSPDSYHRLRRRKGKWEKGKPRAEYQARERQFRRPAGPTRKT